MSIFSKGVYYIVDISEKIVTDILLGVFQAFAVFSTPVHLSMPATASRILMPMLQTLIQISSLAQT